jgi:hypothetical protein
MRVSNPDRSPVGINRRNTAPTPTGFAEIVSDDLAVITRTMFDILSTICQDAQACGDVDSASSMPNESAQFSRCRLVTASPSEAQKQMRNVHLILLPVACDPHPAAGTTDPMACHPNSSRPWTRDPRAGDPHILRSGPAPITACPNIPRTWRDGLRLDADRRWSLSYQHLSRGWTRRCYFSRGGCRHHRCWFLSAANQCTCRQHQ